MDLQPVLPELLRRVVTPRAADSYKGTYGRVLLVGGNRNFGGAIIMAATAAVNAGAGLVTVACDAFNATALHAVVPEAMWVDYSAQAALRAQVKAADVVVIGPGLGLDDLSLTVLRTTLATATNALVIDGSAITLLAQQPQLKDLLKPAQFVLYTPHQMEWQRLSGIAIADQTPAANHRRQQQLNANVMVKRHHSELYFTDGTAWQLQNGNPAMATGGMGDTLTGIIAAFIAQFGGKQLPLSQVVCAAAYTHSAIADELAATNYVVRPTVLSAQLPHFMNRCCKYL